MQSTSYVPAVLQRTTYYTFPFMHGPELTIINDETWLSIYRSDVSSIISSLEANHASGFQPSQAEDGGHIVDLQPRASISVQNTWKATHMQGFPLSSARIPVKLPTTPLLLIIDANGMHSHSAAEYCAPVYVAWSSPRFPLSSKRTALVKCQ